MPFLVYRKVDWWPTIDTITYNGHIVYCSIVVCLAIFYGVNVFMAYNILTITIFYSITISRTISKAGENKLMAGLRSQTDVRMASIITKKYKSESFAEFLNLRYSLWNWQFVVFIVAICIGYPTELLYRVAEKGTLSEATVGKIDDIQFWLFYLGIFNDGASGNKAYFYILNFVQLLGLTYERLCLRWLTDRFGCNYF
jgi:hypothetical protein